jgi:subtilisin family serine protease/subtilisin-like proprotein convertase family protein
MALKFLGANGSGAISNAVKCLDYAVAKGAQISNNSWGGGGYSTAMANALTAAQAAGHLFVAAAGNSNTNNDLTPHYPSSYTHENVLAVAATDRNDLRAGFSSYGATSVDLAAPGVGILSTYGTTYVSMSGTSMATPHVAGAAALVWDAHPTWTYAEVAAALMNTVDVKPNLAGVVATGGRLNVDAAVRYGVAPPADAGGPKVTAANFLGTGGIDGVELIFDEAVDPASVDLTDARLSTPTGQIAPTAVTIDGTEVVFTFPWQSTMGTYSLSVGPGVRDLDGNLMNQDGDGTNGEATEDQFSAQAYVAGSVTYHATDVNKPIADNTRTVSGLAVKNPMTIRGVSVQLNLNHTSVGDLRITLVAPDGTSVLLSNRRGGGGDNYTDTVFHDAAQLTIAQGSAPFTGFYKPETALSALNGKLANGRWELRIDDQARTQTGWLNWWSLTIT